MKEWLIRIEAGFIGLLLILGITAFPVQSVSAQSRQADMVFHDDADRAAGQWAQLNPDGIAVAVRLGDDLEVPVSNVETVMKREFSRHDIDNVRVFFERGRPSSRSTAVFFTRIHVEGPFGLGESLDYIPNISQQLRFEIERGIN